MPLLFKDYTDLVLKSYDEKRDTDQFFGLLTHPTTANIKQQCLNVYNDRINKGQKEEENILTAFFGVPPAGKNFGHVIGKCSPDKFRPFQKFIKREIKNPSLATVDLLAWLIDFNPRPLAHAQRILGVTTDINNPRDPLTDNNKGKPDLSEEEKDLIEIHLAEKIKNTENPEQEENKATIKVADYAVTTFDKTNQKRKLKMAVTTGLFLATLLGGSYMAGKIYRNTNTGCMYWAGDHYEPVSCNEKGKGLLIPLDQEKIKSFRKIMRKDTITEWSVGKLYYIKNKNDIECYTEGGTYPLDITRNLKILSQHMFDTYLRKQKVHAKDSSAEFQNESQSNR